MLYVLQLLSIIATLCTLAGSTPTAFDRRQTYSHYEYDVPKSVLVPRQSSGSYAITGVHTGGTSDSLPLRREIRDLETDSKTWTLYILGLDMLQYTPQTEMLSWFQIAGIHGRPFMTFDNVAPKPGTANNGYCNHVSILFPTWHRPYVALFEQVLHGLIQNIAQQYPEGSVRQQYTEAANNFRVPYWDWAASPPSGENVLPDSIGGSPSITIDGPAGNQTIANPLWSYRFQPLDAAQLPDAPFNQYPETLRYPTTQIASASSQNNLVSQQLTINAPSIRSRLYNLFANYRDYATYATEAWIQAGDPLTYDSIESIHDQIHGLIGGGGHMTYIDYAGFDPTFFLHHAMIDRLFAMWQVLNPDSFVVNEPATYDTYTGSRGDVQDSRTPLEPFHKDSDGGFWTSDLVRDAAIFGYAYAETNGDAGSDGVDQIITAINALYGPSPSVESILGVRSEMDNTNIAHLEWIVNIRVQKYALAAPFMIYMFLGPFNSSPSTWAYEPNVVGTQAVFVKAGNCACNSNTTVTSTIPLTDALVKRVGSLDVDAVMPYLEEELNYRVVLLNGTLVRSEDVMGLRVEVVSVEVEGVGEGKLPVWGDVRVRMEVSS